MIVLAFANGDRRALKDLLSSEVYDSFETVIKDREKHEQKTETRFVSIDKAELVSAEARDRAAHPFTSSCADDLGHPRQDRRHRRWQPR